VIFPDTESSKRTLCVYNLSRFVQPVTLRLDSWRGGAPVEGIGGQRFPAVGDAPYFLSLGPHSFFWFRKRP
jgi:maltose alpha-D-glucosyltransferase/alpha-amylase